jgi:hypothetical protein
MSNKRTEHCTFAVLNHYGKCIAYCSKNTGDVDCKGIKHETIKEYQARVEAERKLH